MKYSVSLSCEDGEYIAECPEMDLTTRALSPTNALDAMKSELRYAIEFCPCTGVGDDYIELDVSG